MASCDLSPETISHTHHVLPRYRGGSDSHENTVKVSVARHAMWHYANYRLWGNLEDRMAWKGLSKQYTKEEILRELSPLGNKPKYLKWYHKDHGLVTDMSINKFCEFYGLDRRNIRRVIKKEQKSHKGWIHYTEEGILRELPPSVDKPKYLKWYHKEHGLVTNMRISELCKFYSLNKRNVYRLMKKERKSHKGWVFIDS